jgi:hypothetical protein
MNNLRCYPPIYFKRREKSYKMMKGIMQNDDFFGLNL